MTPGNMILRAVSLFVFIFLLLPIVVVVVTSFSGSPGLVFPPTRFTLDWYSQISPEFFQAMKVSLYVALGATALSTLLGAPAALGIVRGRFAGRTLINALCLSPLTVPALVIGVALFHFATTLWDVFGLSLAGTIVGLTLGHTAFAIPFVIRAVVAGHAHFDETLEEASLSLGATPLATFFRVTLPLLLPGVLSGAIFSFIMSFDDVPVALFLGGSDATTLPVKIYSSVEFSIDADVMAVSSIVIAGSLVCMLILDRLVGLHLLFGTARA